MRIAIATAAKWSPSRRKGLERLQDQIPSAEVFASETREHASVWARRVWEAAGDNAICILNDDVIVCPDFSREIDAMASGVPGEVIALHTTAAIAPSLAMAGQRWLRSYWVTGPGYILPQGAAKRLLAWSNDAPRQLIASHNEDNVIMHWAWSEQKPVWHCIPGLVQHDTSVPSTLGYDDHPLRSCVVPWTAWPMPDDWKPTSEPILIECPWMPQSQLAATERAYWRRNTACCACHARSGAVTSGPTGATLCSPCLMNMLSALIGNR